MIELYQELVAICSLSLIVTSAVLTLSYYNESCVDNSLIYIKLRRKGKCYYLSVDDNNFLAFTETNDARLWRVQLSDDNRAFSLQHNLTKQYLKVENDCILLSSYVSDYCESKANWFQINNYRLQSLSNNKFIYMSTNDRHRPVLAAKLSEILPFSIKKRC